MTCARFVDLLDAGELAHVQADVFARAMEHARGCSRCALALSIAREIDDGLVMLSPSVPAVDMSRAVLAQIARLDEVWVPGTTTPAPPARWDWRLLVACAGLVASFIIVAGQPRAIGLFSWATMPPTGSVLGTVALTMALACYVFGLFAPVATRRRR